MDSAECRNAVSDWGCSSESEMGEKDKAGKREAETKTGPAPSAKDGEEEEGKNAGSKDNPKVSVSGSKTKVVPTSGVDASEK